MNTKRMGPLAMVLLMGTLTASLVAACGSSDDVSVTVSDVVDATVSLADVGQAGTDVPVAKDDLVAGLDAGEDVPAVVDVPSAPDVPEICRAGWACDDGDPCTANDRCDGEGGCAGEPYACSDDHPCTDDICDGFGYCLHEIRDGTCLIDGRCYDDGDSALGDTCRVCDSAARSSWTLLPNGESCDDGDRCTAGDTCSDGTCVAGAPLDCEGTYGLCLVGGCDPETGACVGTPEPNGTPCAGGDACVISRCEGGECVAVEFRDCEDGNPCTSDTCDPTTGCVHAAVVGACDDGNPCTELDRCEGGMCRGNPLHCADDGNPCTFDYCDTLTGACTHSAEGNQRLCEDGDACTTRDRCHDGVCISGEPLDCDDGDPCTADSCRPDNLRQPCYHEIVVGGCCDEDGRFTCDDSDPCTDDVCVADPDTGEQGCEHVFNTEPCDDFDACTAGDVCYQGACAGTARNCDDDNTCTVDSCDSSTGCVHEALTSGDCDDDNVCTQDDHCQFGVCTGRFLDCADTNACTDDYCDPQLGCQNVFSDAPCDDGDVCTADDRCRQGSCQGVPDACDDGDACTADSCDPIIGCRHQPSSGAACDDGIACTVSDTCVNGICVGDDSGCVCQPPVGPVVVITSLRIGTSGRPGQALDLDANPNTCAPPGQCSDGINNSMATISGLANPELDKAMAEGKLFLLFQHEGMRTDGGEYPLNVFPADIVVEGCDTTTTTCSFLAQSSGFDDDCAPLVTLGGATIDGATFHAGGPGYNFIFNVPLMEGVALDLVLFNATIEGTISISGGRVTELNGILGGAAPKALLQEALLAIPADQLPMDPAALAGLLDTLIRDDIDTDGDGTPDAASVGIVFEARDANLDGTAP